MKVTCGWCKNKEEKSLMIQESNKKYYHRIDCHQEFIKDKEFKQKEREELNSLTDTIVEIMGYTNRHSIPDSFYSSYLQPFRNDDVLFGKIEKKYKEGFSFKTIEETFIYCKNDIKKYVSMKREKGEFQNTMHELRYTWKIVRDNIENMFKAKKKETKRNIQITNLHDNLEMISRVNETIKESQKYIQKDSDEIDITTLLD